MHQIQFRPLPSLPGRIYIDILAEKSIGVVEGGQTVHELDIGIPHHLHRLGIDLVGQQHLNVFLPHKIESFITYIAKKHMGL